MRDQLSWLERLVYSANSFNFYFMTRNSKEVGNLAELQCITGLYELGCDISLPFGNSQKYDLIMDYKGKLYKVQVKHAKDEYTLGEITHFSFATRWQSHNTTGYKKTPYTKNDIDFFATYHQGKVYLIPVEECSGATKSIRYTPPKNGQRIGINFAQDYLAEEVLKKL